jgi:ankyrin repeat protein
MPVSPVSPGNPGVEMQSLLAPLDQAAPVSRRGSVFNNRGTLSSVDEVSDEYASDLALNVDKFSAQLAHKTNGRLPLHMAAIRSSSKSIVTALLRIHPEAVKVADVFGRLPLHYAVEDSGSDEVVISLLKEHPSAASVPDSSGRLPLHLAIAKSRSDAVIVALLDANPKAATVVDDSGRLPLHDAACRISSPSVISLLISTHPQAVFVADHASQLPLHDAAGCNQSDVVSVILAAYPDAASVANSNGSLPLHEAARRNQRGDVCGVLLDAFPEAARLKDGDGRSPLHLVVAFNKSSDVFSLLLNFYADAAKFTDTFGRHPLHDAAARPADSNFYVLQLLKSHPAAASVPDNTGVLPLFYAARHSESDSVVNSLLSIYPQAAKTPNVHGQLPLHVAAGFSKSVPVVSALLSAHPESAKHTDKFGRMPLHECARQSDSHDVARAVFVAYPGAAKVLDEDKCLPLHYAVSMNLHCALAIEILSLHPEAAKVRDQSGRLPLEIASNREVKLIAALISAHPEAFTSVSPDLQDDICMKLSHVHDLVHIILQISDHPLYTCLYLSAILNDFQKEQRDSNVQVANGADEQAATLEQFACAIVRSISDQRLDSSGKEFDACLRFAVDKRLKFFVGEAVCTMRIMKLWRQGYNDDHWLIQCLFYFFLNVFVHMRSKYPPPRVRFYVNRALYFVFLCALVTLPIIKTPGQSINNPGIELFLLYWLVCIFYSEALEIAHFIKDRRYTLSVGLKKYYSDPWSIYDAITFSMSATAASVRISLFFDSTGVVSPSLARQLYAWSLALLWGRLVNVLAAVPFIGPLLIMVLRMVFKDLTRFIVLAVLIEMPFVIALYYLENGKIPESNDFETLGRSSASFFRISIAQGPILQELFGSSWALFAIGSVLLGVLLLNLLIAMFSKTFDIIVENSTQEYLLQKAELTFFWARAPRLPPPLNLFISFRDAITRILGKSVCTGKTFSNFFTASYQAKGVVTFQFDKKAFHKIFPFNKGTQKYKAWIGKVVQDWEQNGEFNSEAHMHEFKSRMLKGIHKLNNSEMLCGRFDAMQLHIQEENTKLERKIECVLSRHDAKANEQAPAALSVHDSKTVAEASASQGGSNVPLPDIEVPAFDATPNVQKQIFDDRYRLDQKVLDIQGLLSEQKIQSESQLDLLREKFFMIHATQKQLQDASQKQDRAIEAVRQSTERKMDAIQKQTEERLQELQTLMLRVLDKLNA